MVSTTGAFRSFIMANAVISLWLVDFSQVQFACVVALAAFLAGYDAKAFFGKELPVIYAAFCAWRKRRRDAANLAMSAAPSILDPD